MADTLDILNKLALQVRNATDYGENTAERVGRLFVGILENLKITDVEELAKFFLRKDAPDETKFLLKLLGGLLVEKGLTTDDLIVSKLAKMLNAQVDGKLYVDTIESKAFTEGALGSGLVIRRDPNTGRSYIEVDELFVRLKATFRELVIEKLSHVGGEIILSPARMKCVKVESFATYYRCYFETNDGEKEINQEFVAGDQARAQTFNIKSAGVYQNVSNRYYWRYVVSVGDNYIDLSRTDCDTNSDIPQAGDDICQLGNRTNPDRQNAIVLSSHGSDAPSNKQYAGINGYILAGKEVSVTSPKGNKYKGDFFLTTGQTVESGIAEARQKAEEALAQLTETLGFVSAMEDTLEEVKRQADGAIESWFYNADPTMSNAPAKDWTTTALKNVHLGDLYYNTTSGKAFRFQLSGSTYSWAPITDTDVTKALANAQKAQDTADGKRRVFVIQPPVDSAYDVGDLWVNATYSTTYTNELLKCKTAKVAGAAFNISHWEKAAKYTDDTIANKAVADAAAADTKAGNAQSTANAAKTRLDTWADDGVISPSEKVGLRTDQANIRAEKLEIVSDATKYTVSATAYVTAYTAYDSDLTYYTNATPENITVLATFATRQAAYYSARTALLEAIAVAAKAYAQTVATNAAGSVKTELMAEINAIPGKITLAVGEVKTYADNAVNNLQIGGRNLFLDTQNPTLSNTSIWNANSGASTWGTVGRFTAIRVTVNWGRLWQNISGGFKAGQPYTLSFWAKRDITRETSPSLLNIYKSGTNVTINSITYGGVIKSVGGVTGGQFTLDTEFQRVIAVFTPVIDVAGNYFRIEPRATDTSLLPCAVLYGYKLELGSKATDWTPAPEDLESRVEKTEAGIEILPAQILLKADKTTVNGLADRIEAAEIKITPAAINLTVKAQAESIANSAAASAVDNLQIGGRNLVLKSSPVFSGTGNINKGYALSKNVQELKGKTVTMSFEYEYSDVSTGTTLQSYRFGLERSLACPSGNWYLGFWVNLPASSSGLNGSGRAIGVKTIPTDITTSISSVPLYIQVAGGTVKIWNFKIEEGDKATDWTPAPEDVDASITAVQGAADTAKANASTANSLLADIASDSKLTASEKQDTQREWSAIVSEYTKNTAQATAFGLTYATYTGTYNTLDAYITPLLASLTTTSDIVGTTFRSRFKSYYDARLDLLNKIAAKAKTLADAAQDTADVMKVNLKSTGIDIDAKTVIVTTPRFLVQNNAGTPIAVFGMGTDGKPKLKVDYIEGEGLNITNAEFKNVTVKGNIYTPYLRLTDANRTQYLGSTYDIVIDLEKTGLNIQFDYYSITHHILTFPKDAKWVGAEANLLFTRAINLVINYWIYNTNTGQIQTLAGGVGALFTARKFKCIEINPDAYSWGSTANKSAIGWIEISRGPE